MNILTISTLYPNNQDFKHGVFVETRLRHLLAAKPDYSAVVIAPVPWFPFKGKCFGEYARYVGVLSQEVRQGIEVHHPRYLVIPKVGMYLTPLFLRWSIRRRIKSLQEKGYRFDLIDGHYFYPDGVAIAAVAEEFGLPFTCTARGTDINLIPQYRKALKMIEGVFSKAAHMMSVCGALKDEMLALGAPADKVTVLRNGVDLELFAYADEAQHQSIKAEFCQQSTLIASVGWLIERKGHHLVIEALKSIPDACLCIAGDGPDRAHLEALARQFGLADRVHFLGALPQSELSRLYQAADMLILASSREGWANVLLEAMASGTPVVATKVWGTPEVVNCEAAGVLVDRTAAGIAEGLQTLITHKPARKETRHHAEQFSWQETSEGQQAIFESIVHS